MVIGIEGNDNELFAIMKKGENQSIGCRSD